MHRHHCYAWQRTACVVGDGTEQGHFLRVRHDRQCQHRSNSEPTAEDS